MFIAEIIRYREQTENELLKLLQVRHLPFCQGQYGFIVDIDYQFDYSTM